MFNSGFLGWVLATGVMFFTVGGGVIWATCFSGSLKGEKTQAEEQDIAIDDKLNPQTSAWAFKDPDKLKEFQEQGLVDKPVVGQKASVDNTANRPWAKTWNIFNPNEEAHASTKRKRPDVQEKIIEIAKENGINPRLMLAFADIETGGKFNPDAEHPNTHASGLFQFMPANWEKYGLGKNGEYRFDIDKNTLAGIKMLKENIDYFHKKIDSSREPTVAELYLMHQQGSGGARALMKNLDMPAHEALRTLTYKDKHGNIKHVYSEEGALKAISQNLLPGTNKRANTITAREFIESWNNQVNKRSKDFY